MRSTSESIAPPTGTADTAPGFSADDLERARAAFRVLLEVACCLLPAAAAPGEGADCTPAATAGGQGGLQTSVLLLLTRLCEESWDPNLLSEMIVAAEEHRAEFIRNALAQRQAMQAATISGGSLEVSRLAQLPLALRHHRDQLESKRVWVSFATGVCRKPEASGRKSAPLDLKQQLPEKLREQNHGITHHLAQSVAHPAIYRPCSGVGRCPAASVVWLSLMALSLSHSLISQSSSTRRCMQACESLYWPRQKQTQHKLEHQQQPPCNSSEVALKGTPDLSMLAHASTFLPIPDASPRGLVSIPPSTCLPGGCLPLDLSLINDLQQETHVQYGQHALKDPDFAVLQSSKTTPSFIRLNRIGELAAQWTARKLSGSEKWCSVCVASSIEKARKEKSKGGRSRPCFSGDDGGEPFPSSASPLAAASSRAAPVSPRNMPIWPRKEPGFWGWSPAGWSPQESLKNFLRDGAILAKHAVAPNPPDSCTSSTESNTANALEGITVTHYEESLPFLQSALRLVARNRSLARTVAQEAKRQRGEWLSPCSGPKGLGCRNTECSTDVPPSVTSPGCISGTNSARCLSASAVEALPPTSSPSAAVDKVQQQLLLAVEKAGSKNRRVVAPSRITGFGPTTLPAFSSFPVFIASALLREESFKECEATDGLKHNSSFVASSLCQRRGSWS
ncbi:hypothetical protein cyc_01150 [Cyclospora cayetanensis]|uniref:Uncharacterized protein n=1 Tax=Cyclospora cayetanensis TaxID=88456 RepID=A0A1D3DA08_9EIME|nr:hypothetical protein cyc_01150 [Cyclospora cayetanensis]